MNDYQEIQQLTHLYALHIDLFQIDEWVDVFTSDAYFDEREFDSGLFVGHEAIRAYGRSLADTVQHVTHLMANLVIRDLTADSASGVIFAFVDHMMKTGERERNHVRYEDQYVKIDGRWKIARRILRKTLPAERVSA